MTIRQLGTALIELADSIDNLAAVNTHDACLLLADKLNFVQAAVPGNPAVIKARVAWYTHVLANFEETFVRPTEKNSPGAKAFDQNWAGNTDSAPGLIMDPDGITRYLRSQYIGEGNFELQERVITLLERVLKTKRGRARLVWQERLTLARRML